MRESQRSSFAKHWTLDERVDFLNHGSFGACPIPVIRRQQELRDELERQPVEFFLRRLPEALDQARSRLADFLGADDAGLVAVPNATSGVNAVLRSMALAPGDVLLQTVHGYNACRNAVEFVADRAGAEVVDVELPFPVSGPGEVLEAVIGALRPKTRLVILDHVTSATGLIFPLEELIAELSRRGIDALVDGAHAPGMLPLELEKLGAAYYTGNCHKWICSPKGAAFLYVREDRREQVRPTVISHGANSPRPGRSRLHDEFDWMGTTDPTAFLCVPEALDTMASMVPGGWPEIRQRNRRLALHAREVICGALGQEPGAPESMIGSLVAFRLPDGSPEPPSSPLYADPFQDRLREEHGFELPVIPWPAPPRRLMRVSAQLYNHPSQYDRLAAALTGSDYELSGRR